MWVEAAACGEGAGGMRQAYFMSQNAASVAERSEDRSGRRSGTSYSRSCGALDFKFYLKTQGSSEKF